MARDLYSLVTTPAPKERDLFAEVTAPPRTGGFTDRAALAVTPDEIAVRRTFGADTPAGGSITGAAVNAASGRIAATDADLNDDWAETARKFSARQIPLFQQQVGGALQALTETGAQELARDPNYVQSGGLDSAGMAESIRKMRAAGTVPGQALYNAAQKDIAANQYSIGDSGLKSYAVQIAEGITQMLPTIATSIATRSPAVASGAMFSGVAGAQYGESRSESRAGGQRSIDASFLDASFMGAAEAIGEAVPLGMMMKPGGRFLSSALKTAGAESVQEALTQVLQTGYAAGVLDEKMTWGEAVRQVVDAGIIGAGVGAGMRGIGEATNAVAARATAPRPVGAIEQAGQVEPTAADEASPLATADILEGKRAIAEAAASSAVGAELRSAGLPEIGKRVQVDLGNGRLKTGRMADIFTQEDPELGAQRGVKIDLDDGTSFDEFLSTLQRGGMSLSELPDAAEVIAEIDALANRPIAAPAPAPARPEPAPAGTAPATTAVSSTAATASKIIGAESGGNASAKNPMPGQTASGLGQFIDSTWLGMAKQHPELFPAGATEAQILALKTDPTLGRRMTEIAVDGYKGALTKAGQPVTDGGVYLMHALGPSKALQFLRNPDAPVESLVSKATRDANPTWLKGDARDVVAWAARKMGGAVPAEASASTVEVAQQPEPEQEVAREEAQPEAPEPAPEPIAPIAEEAPPAPLTTPDAPAIAAPVKTATVEPLTDKSVVVRNATPAQMQAIAAALPPAVKPMENVRAGGMVYSAKHAEKIAAALGATAAPPADAVAPVAIPSAAPPAKPSPLVKGQRVTFDKDVGYLTAGRTYEVDTVEKSGRVNFRNIETGGSATLAPYEYRPAQKDGTLRVLDAAPAAQQGESAPAAADTGPSATAEAVANADPGQPVPADQRTALREYVSRGTGSLDREAVAKLLNVTPAQADRALGAVAAEQAGPTPREQADRATIAARQQQGMARRGGQEAISDQADLVFAPAARPTPAQMQPDRVNRGAVTQMPGKRTLKEYETQGWNAAIQGFSIDDNPYYDTSTVSDRWRKGFRSAASVAAPPPSGSPAATYIPDEQTKQDALARIAGGATLDGATGMASYVRREELAETDPATGRDRLTDKGRAALPAAAPPAYGADNKLVTADRAAELRKRLTAKFQQLNSGLDPEIVALGTELAVFHIEAGARRFADFAQRVTSDLGIAIDRARPFLRGWYNGARDMMEDSGIGVAGMDSPDQVRIEMAAMFRQAEAVPISTPKEATDGVPTGIRPSDGAASAADVQRVAPDGRADRDGAAQERGSARDATRPDEAPADAAERSAGERSRATRGRASGDVGADRVPGRADEPVADRGAIARTDARNRLTAQNWRIEPGALAESRSPAAKARDNLRAIEIIRATERDGRPATQAEQVELARYVGWGGLKNAFPQTDGSYSKGFETVGPRLRELLTEEEFDTARRSVQYAHYTSEKVVRPMWDAVARLGFTGGKVFEPGMGTGNFLGMMPEAMAQASQYSGIEFDGITAKIAALLYPQSGVAHADYTKLAMPKDAYDLVIGNPPFSGTVIRSDPAYAKQGFVLHDFFFAKSLDAVRPGGLLLFVTSAGTLNKVGEEARAYLADRADLVGAVRLPGDAFKENAGTSVTTDIIVLRKRVEGEAPGDRAWVGTTSRDLQNRDGATQKGAVNSYFDTHPEMVLGEEGLFDKLVSGDRYAVRARPGVKVEAALADALATLPADVMKPWSSGTPAAAAAFSTEVRKDGSFYLGADGSLMQQRAGAAVPVQTRGKGVTGGVSAAEQDRIRGLIPVRDSLRSVYAADLAGDTRAAATARTALNRNYDAFVKAFGPINKAEIKYRAPSVIQQEAARNARREEMRLAEQFFDEGAFDPSDMIASKARTTDIAAARRTAREVAAAMGREFDEGTFNPADMPDDVIVKRPNSDAFMDDQEGYRLRAIEHYDDDTGEAKKGKVFFKSVLSREETPQINSAGDALLYTMNQRGRPVLDEIATLAKMSRSDVIDQLGSKIFQLPNAGDTWQTREQYLSGNVRQKLAEAQEAAARDPDYQRNVDALEAVQPAPLTPTDIAANLGMPWIPAATVQQFMKSLGIERAKVDYHPGLAQWKVDGDRTSVASTATWGTSDRPAPLLVTDALNRTDPKIYDTVLDGEGRKKQVLNVEATQAAQDKVRAIKDHFLEWVWSDQKRADDLVGIYNRDFNNLVAPEFDGGYLTTPGIVSGWEWRPHQTRVVSRIIQTGNTYMAHAVGAGKTSAMIGAGMEMRRLGLVRKPMYVVPNHMLGQFTKEFYHQYPAAKIMVADERQFHTDRRKQFVANMASEDLDAVIITHSAFGYIPVSAEFSDSRIEQQLDDYRAMLEEVKSGDGERITVRRVEAQIESLEQKLSGRSTGRKDQVFTFEETGVDFLFVDEAHLFRKLDFATKMGAVRGIDPNGSQASYDLFAKTRYLEQRTPGRSHVLASGTPITNTMAELYSLSRYQQSDELARRGLQAFDAWAGAYGDTVTALEQDPAGGYKPQTRFAKFLNVPELSAMVRQVMDVVTGKQLEQYVVRPSLKGGSRQLHVAQPSSALEEFQIGLQRRMEAIQRRSGPPQKGDDILLSVIGDGRKAAIDMRLIDPSMPATSPASKVDEMIDRAFRIWKETKRAPFHAVEGGGYTAKPVDFGPATQMIFSDLGINGEFPIHKYIANELMTRGVPRSEVAIISDYKSHVARQRLFNDMNDGKVRFLIGSVSKMGTGVNAQRRLYALHNLDPQWYPANDEQRIGRALRQGNMNPEIEVNDYSTLGTYDSQMWGLMEKKQRFIEGFMAGDPSMRSMEDLGESSQYEQAKAMTTSDPRIQTLANWNQDYERAMRRKGAFERESYAVRSRVSDAQDALTRAEQRIPEIEADIAQRVDISGDNFSGKVGGDTFTDRAEFGEAVLARLEALAAEKIASRDRAVGEIAGFPLVADVVKWEGWSTNLYLNRNGGHQTTIKAGTAQGVVTSAAAAVRRFEDDLDGAQARMERANRDIAEFTPQLDARFDGQPEIDQLSDRIGRLERELSAESMEREKARAAAPDTAVDAPKESVGIETEKAEAEPSVADLITMQDALQAELKRIGIADRAMLQAGVNLFEPIGRTGAEGAALTKRGDYHLGVIRVALDGAATATLNHEVIHAMKDLGVFRESEWSTLARAAALDLDLMRSIDSRYPSLDGAGRIEEAVADIYARWRQDEEALPRGFMQSAMRRIRGFLTAILAAVNATAATRAAAIRIMGSIQSGEIGRRPGTAPSGPTKEALSTGDPDAAFERAETEARYQEARKGLSDRRSMVERVKEWTAVTARGFTRHYAELPNEVRFSDLRQQLRKLEAAPQASREKVIRILTRMVGGMDAKAFDLFSRKVMLDDLSWEAAEGHDLPFGFTEQSLAAERAKIDQLVTASPDIQTAVRQRKLANDALARQMVEAGVLDEAQVRNPSYMRHQVLEYALAQAAAARSGGAARLRSPKWAKRMGSTMDINANLLEAEFDWMHKAFTDIETARTIDWIRASEHNIRGQLIAEAKALNDAGVRAAIEGEAKAQKGTPLADANRRFSQKIAMGMASIRSAIDDGSLDPIPASLQDAADAIVTGRRGGEPPFELLAWILDNSKPGSAGAGGVLKAISERREWTKQLLGKRYIDPQDVGGLPKRLGRDGFVAWQPDEGKLMFTAKTLPEHVIDGMIGQLRSAPGVDGALFATILEQAKSTLVVGGDKYQLILPEEVALTLNQLRDEQVKSVLDEVVQVPTRAWKRWVLVNPRRVIKYNLNNLSGDLDAVIAGNPKLLRHVGAAGRELYQVMKQKKAPSDRYSDAVARGVFDSGLSVQEIPEINAFSQFEQLTRAPDWWSRTKKPFAATWNALQGATQWRENVFRYAAYIDYVERLTAGENADTLGYGASIPAMVDAVADTKDKAALLARDLVGDYGDVSVNGRWLRGRLLPFYSWMEVNTRRYWRLSRNAYGQGVGKGIATGGGLALAAGARRSAWLGLRMAMLYGAINLWNHLFFGDDEDELTAEQQRQLHIIVGKWEGQTVTLRMQGALSDALGWFGVNDAAQAIDEVQNGRGSVGDVVKAVAKAPVVKVTTGITPLFSQPMEAATGKKLWPDPFDARPIRDRWRNIFSTFSLENEYDAAMGKPTRGYASSWIGGILYSRDAGEIAYDAARGRAFEWNEKATGSTYAGGNSSPRGDAIYDYKKAVRFGDTAAADRALDKLEALGVTAKDLASSIRNAAPMGGIAKKRRAEFVQQLTPEEFDQLQRAQAWYEDTYL